MAKRSPLNAVSYEELKSELRRRESRVSTLYRKRDKLMAQLAEVDEQIREVGGLSRTASHGATGRRSSSGGTRPRNTMNLADAMASLLQDKTMSVTDIAEAVQRAGYKTTSENFRTIVNQTLLKDKRFKRVGRGQYTAK